MRYRSALALFALALIGLALPPMASPRAALAAGAVPTTVVSEPYSEWAVGGGFVYWASCRVFPDQHVEGGLWRRPLTGGLTRTLATTPVNGAGCATLFLAVDGAGSAYYWNGASLVRRTPAAPDTAAPVFTPIPAIQPNVPPAFDAASLYLATANQRIYRVPRAGGAAQQLIVTAANPSGVLAVGDYIYWLDANGLHRAACASTCGASADLSLNSGSGLVFASIPGSCAGQICAPPSDNLYWVSRETPPRILHVACSGLVVSTCSAQPAFYTPANPPAGLQIGPLATDGASLFWAEGAPASIIASCDNQQLNRAPLSGGGPTAIGPDSNPTTYQVGVDGRCAQVAASGPWVYLDISQSGAKVARLPANAPPAPVDVQANAWEVTQGIQSLNNDVPLVAGKPTFVRLYGSKAGGPRAPAVEAVLRGFRNNVELPGSPLAPINGSRGFNIDGPSFDRARRDDGWLFQLPEGWTSAGALTLQAALDPRNLLGDPNLLDNSRTASFTFSQRAPVCAVFIPVRTNAPPASTGLPNFWEMVARYKTLWPVPNVWTYQQSDDVAAWSWFSFIPYDIPENNAAIITKLAERDIFSDDPDRCDDANARTHYVGMVHPSTNTGTNNGFANFVFAASWVKLPPAGASGVASTPSQPQAGAVMAQELSHNYNGLLGSRWEHVNCGGPSGLNLAYPYNPCKLDDRIQPDPAAHYGFDPLTLTPVPPDTTTDYMSYKQPKWVSDYNWRGMFDEIGAGAQLQAGSLPRSQPAAAAGSVVLITGVITPTAGQAQLSPALLIPSDSAGPKQLAKWQRLGTPPAGVPLPNVRVQLLAADNSVVADQQVNLGLNDDSHEGGPSTYPLIALVPAPGVDVARINLLLDGVAIACLTPPAGQPQLTLDQPAGGATVSDLLTVQWVARHPNPGAELRHTIQYSPDLGQHWRVLAAGYAGIPGQANQQLGFTDLRGLPGSAPNSALVRVITTDGYHTAIATSQPFTLAPRPPQPFILSPAEGQQVAADTPLGISGGASDPRDGALAGDALRWTIDGTAVGIGQAQSVAGLAPGTHTLTLTARNSAGLSAGASVTFTVAPLVVPSAGDATPPDGSCDDARYANAARVPLAAPAGGQSATALLVRSANDLWLCLSGLPRGVTPQGARAGIAIDVDNSRDPQPQPSDYGFFVGEDGTPYSLAGAGGSFSAPGPAGMQAAISATAAGWSAELQVPAALLGGWGRVVGIDLVQQDGAALLGWPARGTPAHPSSWGAALLGEPPHIDALSPSSAQVGSPNTTLTITGGGFVGGTAVLWNGSPRPTTFVSAAELRATILASDLASAGTATIAVANPGLAEAPSNQLLFEVVNPAPVITDAQASGDGARCLVRLRGSGWAAGVQLIWDGNAYPATRSGDSVEASIPCVQLRVSRSVRVAAYNPAPGGGVSNLRLLAVQGRQLTYLPLTRR